MSMITIIFEELRLIPGHALVAYGHADIFWEYDPDDPSVGYRTAGDRLPILLSRRSRRQVILGELFDRVGKRQHQMRMMFGCFR